MAVTQPFTNQASQLGNAKGYFPGRRRGRGALLLIAVAFLLGGTGGLIYGFWQAGLQYQRFGSTIAWKTFFLPGLPACALLILAVLFGVIATRRGKKALTIYENGFVLHEGEKSQVWLWENVAAITSNITRTYLAGIYSGTRRRYILQRVDGVELSLDDSIPHVEKAVRTIQSKTFQRRFEPVARQLASGKKIPFGQVLLAREGIRIKDNVYRWDDLGRVEMRKGKLIFTGRKKISLRVEAIPNLDVLVTILVQNVPSGG